jgi:hypothetical protein
MTSNIIIVLSYYLIIIDMTSYITLLTDRQYDNITFDMTIPVKYNE